MTDHISQDEYRQLLKQGAEPTPTVATPQKAPHDYKADFLTALHNAGIPAPEKEVHFAKPRMWRWDFAWPELKIACEYQGGIYMTGPSGHKTPRGLEEDYEKITNGSLREWIVILINAKTVTSGQALQWIEQAFELRRRQRDAGKERNQTMLKLRA